MDLINIIIVLISILEKMNQKKKCCLTCNKIILKFLDIKRNGVKG
jgi:hypothetical protein